MRVLNFICSRQFRWPVAIALVVCGMALMVVTRGESLAPLGLGMLAGFIAWEG